MGTFAEDISKASAEKRFLELMALFRNYPLMMDIVRKHLGLLGSEDDISDGQIYDYVLKKSPGKTESDKVDNTSTYIKERRQLEGWLENETLPFSARAKFRALTGSSNDKDILDNFDQEFVSNPKEARKIFLRCSRYLQDTKFLVANDGVLETINGPEDLLTKAMKEMEEIRRKEENADASAIYHRKNRDNPQRDLERRELSGVNQSVALESIKDIKDNRIRGKLNEIFRNLILQGKDHPSFDERVNYGLSKVAIQLHKEGLTKKAYEVCAAVGIDTSTVFFSAPSGKFRKLDPEVFRKRVGEAFGKIKTALKIEEPGMMRALIAKCKRETSQVLTNDIGRTLLGIKSKDIPEDIQEVVDEIDSDGTVTAFVKELVKSPSSVEARERFMNRLFKLRADLQELTIADMAERELVANGDVDGVSDLNRPALLRQFRQRTEKFKEKVISTYAEQLGNRVKPEHVETPAERNAAYDQIRKDAEEELKQREAVWGDKERAAKATPANQKLQEEADKYAQDNILELEAALSKGRLKKRSIFWPIDEDQLRMARECFNSIFGHSAAADNNSEPATALQAPAPVMGV